MKTFNGWCLLLCGLLILTTTAIAQVRPGPPFWKVPRHPGHGHSVGTLPFESFGGGPFDSVNLGNLNVHLDIPLLNKPGRGMPFTYSLSYDSSVWTQVSSNGVLQWQPAYNWGWRGQSEIQTGYLSFSTSTVYCYYTVHLVKYVGSIHTITSNYVYHDPWGRPHPFAGQANLWTGNGDGGCTLGSNNSVTATTTDGSGYSLNAPDVGGGPITTVDGTVIKPPYNTGSGTGSTTDSNGNEITVNSSGQFFDTLSGASPVLTVSSASPPTSTTFSYTAPSNATAMYTMNYQEYTVATNFGILGVAEYGPGTSGIPLVNSIQLPDGTQYQFTYEKTPGSSCTPLPETYSTNCVTGRIASVTLPTGGTITYVYTGGSNGIFSDGSTAGLQRILAATTTCNSSNPCWQYARTLESGPPGSGSSWRTTVIDPNGNNTVISFAEDANTTSPTYSLYETGRVINQLISGTQTPLLTTTTCYNGNYANCNATFTTVSSPITQTDFYRQLPNGKTALSEITYNGYGLVTGDSEYDYGAVTGSAPGKTHEIRQTSTAYYALTNGIADMLQTVSVYDWTSGSKKLIASTAYTFDGAVVIQTSGTPQHVSVGGVRGNLTTIQSQANSTTFLYRQSTYYDTGMLNNSTSADASSSTTCANKPSVCTTYNYSNATATCGNAFATSISEPLSLLRSMTWNCTGGVMTQLTDENLKVSQVDYTTDPYFWRPDYTEDPLNNKTNLMYTGQTVAESTLSIATGSVSDIRVTLDGFGRTILGQQGQTPSPTEYDTTETDYNNVGLVSRSTLPFQAAASTPSGTAPGVTTNYDALGRPWAPPGSSAISDSGGGTVSYTYTNNDVLQTVSGTGSTQSFQKQLEYDGLGRPTSVCEVTAGTTAWPGGACGQSNPLTGYLTTYVRGISSSSNPTLTVTQNAQATSGTQTRTYTYDFVGRLTSETNPETGNGSPGTVSYTYDVACGSYAASAGDLTKRVDNAGNTTCYGYDSLHRLTDAGNSGPTCRHYRYDSQTPPSGVTVSNTLSRMAEAYTDNCTSGKITDEWYGYDADGRLTDVYEKTPNSGGYYHAQTNYWANGALNSLSAYNSSVNLIYPTINYGGTSSTPSLDGEGRYTKVTASSGTSPVTGVTYVTTGTSEPIGALTGVTLGSSDSDSFTYDPNTGRPKTYTFSVNGVNDKGTLTWNANGTLNQLLIADSLSGTTDSQTCNYLYDDLGRSGLIPTLSPPPANYAANCGTTFQQNFRYDPFGNISKAGSDTFSVIYSATTNQISSFTYDNNGNALTDNLNTYTWDPNWGNPAKVNSTNLIYDANGQMVEQQNGSTYTQFLYSPAGKTAIMNGQTLVKSFVYLPGGGTAIYNSTSGPAAYYRHTDWLGSSRLTSTASRAVYSDSAYAPFGEQYVPDGTADASFTGQNADTTSTLYDFPLREYSPTQGRWISPDPAGTAAVDPTNPQSWNRYAYVENMPLNSTDPLGLYCPVLPFWENYQASMEAASTIHCSNGSAFGISGPDVWTGWGGGYSDGSGYCGTCGGPSLGSGLSVDFSGMPCSDFMPCGVPFPTIGQAIWSGLLGLPNMNIGNCMPICDAANNGTQPPGVPKPPNPILQYDKCVTQNVNPAKNNAQKVSIINGVTNLNGLGLCAFTGPDAPLCVGVLGGVATVNSLVFWAGGQITVYDAETQCLQQN